MIYVTRNSRHATARTVAYEMLGSAADAEDVLQETWMRWVDVGQDVVRDPRSYPGGADRGRRITGLYFVRNPEKLSRLEDATAPEPLKTGCRA